MLVETPVDGRADIYSLGCVRYLLLAGRAPFAAHSATAVIAQHLNREPERRRTLLRDAIPQDLDAIVIRYLAMKPESRPQTAVALKELLAQCARNLPWTQAEARQRWQLERRSRITSQDHETESNLAQDGTLSEVKQPTEVLGRND